jgi:putative ABC transport system permease protein
MSLLNDVRLALRGLWREWRLAAVAIMTLALGIGPNTAIFSAVHALLLEPLPFPGAEQLVRISAERGGEEAQVSYREVRDVREELGHVFEGVAAYTDQGQYNSSGDGRPEELVSTITTQDLFAVLGTTLLLGEPWPEALDRSRDFKLVISHGLWQRRFGGARDVLGKTMTLDGAPGYTIVGVTPPGFAFPIRSDLYRSHGIVANPDAYENRAGRSLWGLGRLRTGVTLAQAQEALAQLAVRTARDFPASNTGITYRVTPLRDLYIGNAGPYLVLVLAAAGLALLVACSNVANLLLARALGREREVSVRLALGARRALVVRSALVESVVLGTVSAIAGVVLGWLALRGLQGLIRLDLPVWMTFRLSPTALGFTVAIATVAGVLSGVVPAVMVGRGDLTGALKEGGRGSSAGAAQRRWRAGLVIGQVALAVMLVSGAGLLMRSFRALTGASPGFDADSVLSFRVELGWRAYPSLAAKGRFQAQLTQELERLPGVRSVGLIDNLPLDGRPRSDTPLVLSGQSTEDQRQNPFVNVRAATAGAFGVLRIPLKGGRSIGEADRDSSDRIAVVSQAAARRFWPRKDPLGARILLGTTDSMVAPWRTVVGVVGDVRHESMSADPALDVYLPLNQYNTGSLYALVRTDGDPRMLARLAPELTWKIDPDQSFFDVRPLKDRIADRVWVPRLAGVLFSAFGALTAILAAIGVSAVLAYSVRQRSRELGVRQALGASPGSLSRTVVRDGGRLVLAGGVLGVALALVLATVLRAFLFGVGVLDAPTLGVVLASMVVLAGVASWLPARRAMRVSPLEAIRGDS